MLLGTAPGQQRITVTGEGAPGSHVTHVTRCWVLAPENVSLFTFDFSPGINSHSPTFSNTKVFRSLLRKCFDGVHALPIIIILFLLWASCSRGTPTTQLKLHWNSHHRALEAHNFQYHQQEIPHPTLNPGNPWEASQGCFTTQGWNGLRPNSKRIIFFPFQAGQAVFGMLTSTGQQHSMHFSLQVNLKSFLVLCILLHQIHRDRIHYRIREQQPCQSFLLLSLLSYSQGDHSPSQQAGA